MTSDTFADLQFVVNVARNEQIQSLDDLRRVLRVKGMQEDSISNAISTWRNYLLRYGVKP